VGIRIGLVGMILILLLIPYLMIFAVVMGGEEPVWAHEISKIPVPPKPDTGRVIIVDQEGAGDFRSVSDAVRNAALGDKIVIKPGVYYESVVVDRKAWITIEGVDRDSVILDGGMRLGNGIYVVFAPHVKIANLTVRNYLGNGIFYVNSDYFEVFNVRAVDNRVYGVNFLASEKGRVSYVIASGSGDSGIYVGEVTEECNCVIEYSEAYNNSLGYSGTRANGVMIRHSYFHDNAIGIAPNTLLPDVRMFVLGKWPLLLWASHNVIENNLIENNNNHGVKAAGFAASYGVPVGVGIAMIGSHSNIVRNNTIKGNEKWGIAEWYFLIPPYGNVYVENRFSGNGADYWRDGWGFFGCSVGERSTGDGPPSCALASFLRLTIPNPLKHFELMLNLEIPGQVALVLVLAVWLMENGKEYSRVIESLAKRSRHIAASLIDALLAGDIYIAIAVSILVFGFGITEIRSLVDGVTSLSLLLLPLAYFIWMTSWVIYSTTTEAVKGKTLGKYLLNLQVMRYGYKPVFFRTLIRNLLKYVDLIAFGLVGLAALIITGRTVGDVVAGTYVGEKT